MTVDPEKPGSLAQRGDSESSSSETEVSLDDRPAEDAFQEPPPELEKAISRSKDIDWDSDPANPYNWSTFKKAYHVSVPSVFAFICTLGSSIYTSGIGGVMEEFGVSQEAAQLGLSLYILGLAFGPIMAAPLSEHLGRRPVYISTFLAASLFTLGAGFSQNFSSLLACRFFAGFFSGPVLSVGSGTIADIYPPVYRCLCISIYTGCAFFAPILGPVMGGFAVENTNWRWTQWIILFWSVLGCIYIIPFKETHKGTLLKARAKRLNKTTEVSGSPLERTTSIMSKEARKRGWDEAKKTITVVLLRAVKMLFTEPILFSISLYVAFNFGIFYGFFGAWNLVFQGIYGFDLGIFGLTWLGLFVGAWLAIILIYTVDTRIYQKRHFRAVAGGKPNIPPENRLYPAMFGCVCIPIALFWFGWTSRADIHWIVPIIGSAFFTLGNLCVFVSGMLYLTDTYGATLGASALAANGLLRYAFATAFPLFSRQMYEALGIGWASSLLGFVSIALCFIPFILFRYGPKLRARSGRNELG